MTREERENAIRILKEDKATCEYNLNKAPSAKHIGQVLKDIFESRIKAYKIAIQTLQESSKDMEEIEEIINCDADAEIKLKMISNIVHSKPHYFKVLSQEPTYCDRNICLKNEYNGISCDECEVTKSQESKAERVFKMRDATPEEQEAIDKYIKSISKPTGVNFGALEQEPCEDAISRQEVLDVVNNPLNIRLDEIIKQLPSVKPQEPKTGHWKRISMDKYSEHAKYWYRCDRCGKDNLGNTDWCPHCGARMVEPQESEDKECQK